MGQLESLRELNIAQPAHTHTHIYKEKRRKKEKENMP